MQPADEPEQGVEQQELGDEKPGAEGNDFERIADRARLAEAAAEDGEFPLDQDEFDQEGDGRDSDEGDEADIKAKPADPPPPFHPCPDAHPHPPLPASQIQRSEEHTSELQSLMRISYAVFCLKKKKKKKDTPTTALH